MKVLLTTTSFQDTPGKHQDLLDSQGFEITRLRGPLTESELLPIIGNYDAVICGDDDFNDAVLQEGKRGNLKFLSKYGVGLDKIDLKAASELNIKVTNCPGVNQISVSEHVLALLLAFERNIHLQYNSVQKGSWNRWVGHEIQGKRLGIIGLGAVGRELLKKAKALGLEIFAFDINISAETKRDYPEVNFVSSVDGIYKNCDYISLHVPLLESTRNLISKEVIENELKCCPIIINTARGGLVDSAAIIDGLKNSKIRGYLTDVLNEEPINENEILLGVEGVIITPHVGSRTFESVERQGLMAVNNLLGMIAQS
jgi:D-3-phosphoglycerate dehydrogenase